MKTTTPKDHPLPEAFPEQPLEPADDGFDSSPELAAEITRVRTEARIEADRKQQEELARQRELARFD